MANTKISQLPSATTPVVGTEVLPIVQSSTTSKVSIANLTAGRDVSAATYAATGTTVPSNGMYLPTGNTLSFASNTTRVLSLNVSAMIYGYSTYAGLRNFTVSNTDTGSTSAAQTTSASDAVSLALLANSTTHGTSLGFVQAGKAVLYAGGTAGGTGLQIWDNTAAPQIDFLIGTTTAGTVASTGDWSIPTNINTGQGNPTNGSRYIQVTNADTGTSAYSSLTARSDVQTLNLQASSSTRASSGGVTLAGKAVLYATKGSGGVTSTGLTIWDQSTNPQIDFVVGTTYAGTIASSGDWSLGTKTLTAGAFIPSGSTVPTNGMYLPSSNNVSFAINSARSLSLNVNTMLYGYSAYAGLRNFTVSNTDTGSTSASQVTSTADAVSLALLANSTTHSTSLGFVQAGKAVLYAGGTAGGTGLQIWDNTASPQLDFLVGTSTAASINSSAVLSLTNNPILSGGTANGVAYLNGSKVLTTGTALTFDGSKLTIGTPTASGALTVVSGASTAYGAFDAPTSGFAFHDYKYNGTRYGLIGQGSALYVSGSNTDLGILASNALVFGAGGSEKMRLDSSGNLGLGVTPSAWVSTYKGFEIAAVGKSLLASPFSDSLYLSDNAYVRSDGNFAYARSSQAVAMYGQLANTHAWYNAASGTAGNAISFTQAMTLDASGNLGVGATSPTQRLHLSIGSATAIYNRIQNSAGDCYLGLDTNGNTNLSADNSGNQLIFKTQAVERARIDSSGNLLVNATSAFGGSASKLQVVSTGGTEVITVKATNSSGTRYMISFQNQSGTYVGSISQDGTNTTYGTSSDYRLKENIQPMQGALGVVAQLKPCTYTWKSNGSDGQGFIAHELQAVVPDCVTGEKDAVDADGNPVYQGIDTSFLVATLTAAIQELKAEFDAYKAAHP